jgi:hypothetical protein
LAKDVLAIKGIKDGTIFMGIMGHMPVAWYVSSASRQSVGELTTPTRDTSAGRNNLVISYGANWDQRQGEQVMLIADEVTCLFPNCI